MKKFEKKPAGAKEKFGVNIKVNKGLDKFQGKDLFPRKTEEINKIVSMLTFR
jgi:hypothetical protein